MSGPNPSSAPTTQPVPPAVNGWSAEYLDQQYSVYKADPVSLPADIRAFFDGFDLGYSRTGAASSGAGAPAPSSLQSKVDDLVAAYRALGHRIAKTDPFGRQRQRPAALTIEQYGISQADLDAPVHSEVLPGNAGTLRQLLATLESIYCESIGVEFMHIPDDAERAWWRARFEGDKKPPVLSRDEQVRLLEQLTSVERFEGFLGKRFMGKKRFSIEGAESTLPLLKFLTQRAGELGVQELILGMAHRGRLAVLKDFVGKDLAKLFTEFKDAWVEGGVSGGGDVKYHRGYSGDQQLLDGRIVHLSMLNNPSHLESVNPVVMGRTRAKQDLAGDTDRRRVASLLIHGDAAVAGQGIVAECLAMSQLDGYAVGGTLHVVINNLVGFTTDPVDARSTEYCTDIAKMINAPVLHVNGDDPEAVVKAARLAVDYRQEFRKDVFVDLVCFRRYGHNEQDEPGYTQPQLYALVKAHPGTPETYRRRLTASGVITQAEAEAMSNSILETLDEAYAETVDGHKPVDPVPPPGGGQWQGLSGAYSFESPKTSVDAKIVGEVCAAMGRAPSGFNVHPKLQQSVLAARANLPQHTKLAHNDAEQIAVGTLLLEGVNVRLSGQDCRRGTFTQRHAVLRDEKTGERYTPLNNIRAGQTGRFQVWDSPLSEYGVMGFDYGYCRANPRALVMWEGQFGDFVNGAQILIDQYLASSEVKWHRWAGLVLLLPHGYEGQGPEHSSARLERFLQLCADDNMEVVYPSTAAQTFHMLRRQALRTFRKPLIVMTPKKYLRVETSTVAELSTGSFQHVIDDPTVSANAAKAVTSVVYCTGKVYHELAERREKTGRKDVALVRVEQLYPLHTKLVKEIDARYPKSAKRSWCQEEPRNQGAFIYIQDAFRESCSIELSYIGRPACASPATGSEKAHAKQQDAILTQAIAALPGVPSTDDHHGQQNGSASAGAKSTTGAVATKTKR
jgi:2-oxoglutarate dehydrogenase E1 component